MVDGASGRDRFRGAFARYRKNPLKSRDYDFGVLDLDDFVHFLADFGLGDAEFGLGDTVNLWIDASGLWPDPLNLTFSICGLAFGLWVYVWSTGYIKLRRKQ